jgi:HSP20 family protein
MALVSFDPVEGLLRLQAELDRFFGKPQIDIGLSGPNVFPPINVFTDDDGFVIRAEVPGIKPSALNVQIEGGQLTISGERTESEVKGSHHRRERRLGRFSRTVQLPRDIDVEKAAAEVRNGVLTLRVPKAASARPRHIEVHVA